MKSDWPKAVLFDLDDTILAFDSVADKSWLIVLKEHAAHFGTNDIQSMLGSIKSTARLFWSDPVRHREGRLNLEQARKTIVTEALAQVGVINNDLVRLIVSEYDQVRTDAIHPIRGAIETVEAMRDCGIKLALVTNGSASSQRHKIERFGLIRLFDSILIEGEVGYGKPDERTYRRALSELSVDASDTWMVGDNWNWEVVAPQRLGIKGVWVNAQGIPTPDDGHIQPFRIIKTLSELDSFFFTL